MTHAARSSLPDIQPVPDRLLDFPRARAKLALLDWGDAQGVNTYEQPLDGSPGPTVSIRGERHLMLSSYDYLGLAGHPALKRGASDAVRVHGAGSGGVRLLTGTTVLHRTLEARLAEWLGTEDALVTGSGFLANLAAVPHLVGRGDLIVADEFAHRSLADACGLSMAEIRVFPHNDVAALDRLLADGNGRRTLVLVEGVYSMEGDLGPLPQIRSIASRYGAFLLVDEAHALGTMGATGRGSAEHAGLAPASVDVWTGSLSKALGAHGGFVAGSRRLIHYLRHEAAPYIFSAALPPAAAGAALAALDLLAREPDRVERMRETAARLRAGLRRLGLLVADHPTPIVPLPVGDEGKTWRLARLLLDRRVVASPVAFPAVPRGKARLRLCAMASHTARDIASGLRAIARALEENDRGA